MSYILPHCPSKCPAGFTHASKSNTRVPSDSDHLYASRDGQFVWFWDIDVKPLLECLGELTSIVPTTYDPQSEVHTTFFQELYTAFETKRSEIDPHTYSGRKYEGQSIDRSVMPSLAHVRDVLWFMYDQPYAPNTQPKRDTRVTDMLIEKKISLEPLFPPPRYMGPN